MLFFPTSDFAYDDFVGQLDDRLKILEISSSFSQTFFPVTAISASFRPHEFRPATPHAARPGPRVESADDLVELSGRLVAFGRRKFLEAAAAVAGRERALHRRHVFERRVRRGL